MTSYELIHFKKMVRVWKTKSLLFCFKISPTNRSLKAKSYNFHFQNNDMYMYIYSCEIALLRLTEDWRRMRDRGELVA